jgi:type IX secretion system PorP/SprF family membrane protein
MRFLLLPLLILTNLPLWGQRNDIFPDLYSAYFNNVTLINPSFIPSEGKVDLVATYKNRIGPFSKIATYSFTGAKVFRKENQTAHLARIIFFNEKEGPYIQRPRGYANYAYSLPLTENTQLSAGIALGFSQIAFSAPSATGVGTAMLPDGSLGLSLRSKDLSFGISSLQLFNASSEAINALIRLRRHYNFFLSTQKDLSLNWKVKGYFFYRILPYANNNTDITLALDYKNVFCFGSSIRYRQGMSFFVTFNINLGKDRLLLNFAYNSPILSNSNNLLNSVELTTGYVVN